MRAYRQSVSWWCFVPKLLNPEQFVRAAAEIGYAAVELLPEAHWNLARDHGLAIAAIDGHASIVDGLNRRKNHPRIVRELEARIAKAEAWGIANLICFSGSRSGLDNDRWFGHYHTAGNPGRGELDAQQELNYAPILAAIAATGYSGYIGHEFIPKGDPVAGMRAAFALAQAD